MSTLEIKNLFGKSYFLNFNIDDTYESVERKIINMFGNYNFKLLTKNYKDFKDCFSYENKCLYLILGNIC